MKNKGIAYKRMLVSFAMVFVVPLCLVFAVYLYSYHVIEDQIEASNDNFVHTIQSACDRELQYYQNVLTQLSMNELVEMIGDRTTLSNADRIAASDLINSIFEVRTSISLLGNECKEIFIYFPKVNMVFSNREKGSMRFETYAQANYSDDQTRIEELREYLSTFSRTGLISANMDKSDEDMVLVTYCSGRSGNTSNATLGIWLDMNELIKRIASVEWGHGYDWLIIDTNGKVVKGASGAYHTGDQLSMEMLSENGKYMVYTAQSNVSEWSYILLMPRELVQSSAGKIQTFFAFSILLSVLIAYFLIKKATKLNYEPLERLLSSFQIKDGEPAEHNNEYQLLNDQIKNLMNENTSMESHISTSKKSMTRWGLINLLINPGEIQENKQDDKYYSSIQRFSGKQNLVLIIKERVEGENEVSLQFTKEMKLFIVENIFMEGIGAILPCSIVELEGRQILVLNDDDICSRTEKLQERIFELQGIIYDNFKLNLSITTGAVHSGLEGIHKSYLEAREAEEFIPILDQDFISYVDIKDKTSRRYNYSLQAEERISAAVQSNNAQLAIALIHKVIDINWSDNQISPNILKLLLNDIFCTLLKTADEKGCIDRIYMLPKELGIHNSVSEIKEHFTRVVESICEVNEIMSQTSAEKALCEKILEYVQQNYAEPSLNVSQTAFHFHMSPTALSATFKNETGKSLLMVINEVRIENAMKLLKQGCSVSDTAEKVGIPESSSFIRLFKKYVGITPGQMKSQMFDKK